MFWSVLGRMLWARRAIVLITLVCSLGGGLFVVLTSAPRYDATARVILNFTQPSISGVRLTRRTVNAHVQSQIRLIRDPQVVGPALEAIGWMDSPDLIESYNARPPGDQRDYPTWLAQSVVASLQAYLVPDSDILEIKYRAASPDLARLIVGAVRDAYIASNVNGRRTSAEEDAEAFQRRAVVMAADLAQLEARQRDMERKTGIIIQADGVDMESRRLRAMATSQGAPKESYVNAPLSSRRAMAELDAKIAAAAATYGPNHPRLAELRNQRAVLEIVMKQESGAEAAVAGAVSAQARLDAATIGAQTAKVLDQRVTVLQMRVLRDEIMGKRLAQAEVLKRMAVARQQASTNESGLTPTGEVHVDVSPSFPNKPLILGGAGAGGLIGGILIALMVELLNLRVRTRWGLGAATGLQILGSFPNIRDGSIKPARRRIRLPWPRLKPARV